MEERVDKLRLELKEELQEGYVEELIKSHRKQLDEE